MHSLGLRWRIVGPCNVVVRPHNQHKWSAVCKMNPCQSTRAVCSAFCILDTHFLNESHETDFERGVVGLHYVFRDRQQLVGLRSGLTPGWWSKKESKLLWIRVGEIWTPGCFVGAYEGRERIWNPETAKKYDNGGTSAYWPDLWPLTPW